MSERASALTRGAHGTARECTRAEEFGADKSAPLGNEREREKEESAGTGWHRQVGTTCQGRQARGRLDGPVWAARADLRFFFFPRILMAFLFYFL
jgi:hypothetical protein